ncbi:Similar to citrate lyase beta subunit [Bathymodiolus heckerae thiotrophic gill symbiont]|uniref:HpcH/HpaI aldolase/citrate lyase family protein n=1 Tax=Bathymodiolus heckerae thiotrophic gill symbiont TaxID=1052212 RepID=UPI0010B35377|nr:HpcH/HpaI aldolase/citrate lyase family protein [Bathymodiolus heckerae thiotrophic gill symbiont]SHN92001.1 Similar to citrate lyase beta subunit [Bathymodiolus heckerae thiotrophic gill symbiont]
MPEHVSYFDLGATLYTPCTHGKLSSLLQHSPSLTRSMVLCLEDSVREDELNLALNNLKVSLKDFKPNTKVKRFIRPRNPLVLAEILSYDNIDKIDGFVLPKFDLNTIDLYKKVIDKQEHSHFSYMPILETAQVFERSAMIKLRQLLKEWGGTITCLRIGGNDLMNILGIKRLKGMTTYDTPIRSVIDQLIIIFRPENFELSAPVFDIIEDLETLKKEVIIDLSYGFYAKTAIHPSQVDVIESVFSHFIEGHSIQSERVLDENVSAVFKFNGQMMERTCHRGWATRTTQLAKRYN